MQPRFALVLGTLGLAAGLVAAPIGVSNDPISLDGKSALANPGNGKGHGKGHGSGGMPKVQSHAQGQGKDKSSHGLGPGHRADAVSGVGHSSPPGQARKAAFDALGAYTNFQGSFHAVHANAKAMGVASPDSEVAKVKAYLDAVGRIEAADTNDAPIEVAIETAAQAAAVASNHTVTVQMLDGVHEIGGIVGVDPATTQAIAKRAAEIQDD